jgi:predicted GNAT family N-acyltransferase
MDDGRVHIEPVEHGKGLWAEVEALRLRVYVDEQAVPLELELDEFDPAASHFAALVDGVVAGTLRIVWEGPHAHIGRLAVDPGFRRKGIARALLTHALEAARRHGSVAAVLDAQTWITHLYRSFGFAVTSGVFMDAGIPHVRMERRLEEVPCP